MSKARFLVFSFFLLNVFTLEASDTDLDTPPLSQKYACSKKQENDELPLFILDEHNDYYRRKKCRRREDDSTLTRQPRVYKLFQRAERPVSQLEIEQAKKIFFGQHKKLITAFLKSCKNEEKQETTFVFPAGKDICVSYECLVSFENKLSLKKVYTDEQLEQWCGQSVYQEGIELVFEPKQAVSSPLPTPPFPAAQISLGLNDSFNGMRISER